jgi:lipoprotein NlpD
MRLTRSNRLAHLLPLLLALSGCTLTPWQMPAENRTLTAPPQTVAHASGQPAQTVTVAADQPVAPAAPGYYRVKPGDTLYHIAAAQGQRSDDLIKWNTLTDPAHIETGKLLRVKPPAPLDAGAGKTASETDKPEKTAADTARFGWPARGTLVAVYGQGKSKNMMIAAKAGDPVKAAAAGRVVFAGDGGKPYGKLIVIKHDDTLVTAYGHNRKLLVKEGAAVKRGQLIAEMAETEGGNGSLRFEVRKNGKQVDPAPYLPRVGA